MDQPPRDRSGAIATLAGTAAVGVINSVAVRAFGALCQQHQLIEAHATVAIRPCPGDHGIVEFCRCGELFEQNKVIAGAMQFCKAQFLHFVAGAGLSVGASGAFKGPLLPHALSVAKKMKPSPIRKHFFFIVYNFAD